MKKGYPQPGLKIKIRKKKKNTILVRLVLY